jgi:hypothetical protein
MRGSSLSRTRNASRRLTATVAGAVALALAAPGSAFASPLVEAEVFSTGKTTAIVHATVFPEGETTHYHVAWSLASSTWCMGAAVKPEHESAREEVSAKVPSEAENTELAGLTQGARYCTEAVAQGGVSTAHSRLLTFTAGAPTVLTFEALSTGTDTASVSGGINPAGQTSHYKVDYAQAGSPWCRGEAGSPQETAANELKTGSPSGETPVTVALSALAPGTEYCAELVGENETGVEHGELVRFVAGLPSVLDYAIGFVHAGLTSAVVEAAIDPANQPTHYELLYGVQGSPWCSSGGLAGAPAGATAPAPLAAAQEYVSVSIVVTGLSAGTEYCAEVVATNTTGTARGEMGAFKTEPVYPLHASVVGGGRISGPGIECSSTCASAYARGTHVTITAIPAAGWSFSGWSGACGGTAACAVTMNGARQVTATFKAGSVGAAPPTLPPIRKRKPVVNTRTGEIELEYAFPEAGQAEAYGEISQGAALARSRARDASAAQDGKGKKCRKGHARKARKCVSDEPVRYGRVTLTVSAPGVHKLRIKPGSRVLSALKKGRRLSVKATLVFTPAGTKLRIPSSTTVAVQLKSNTTRTPRAPHKP